MQSHDGAIPERDAIGSDSVLASAYNKIYRGPGEEIFLQV